MKVRIFRALGHYFIPVDKKNAVIVRIHFQNDQHKCVFSLGIAFAKLGCVGLGGSVLVGKWVTLKACGGLFSERSSKLKFGVNATHAPAWFVRRLYRDL
jgi:hypothetical protein